ncbi:helix-turn-helix transcriptional regulator [Gordonia sputi]|uniref:helix-turn-helix transcriptional regulator n=1 Tax=Gordonia sputi TaxID=36823 RepID=UPI0036C6D0B8
MNQVSEMSSVSRGRLYAWARDREAGLPAPGPVHSRLSPNKVRWRRGDVEAWLDGARVANPEVREQE